MITLYCYPGLYGLPDNNPFGLKIDAFLRLHDISFTVKNILNLDKAPRGQLPYIEHNGRIISDSNCIIAYLTEKFKLAKMPLNTNEQLLTYLMSAMLDNHLYWVMSFSRWQDSDYYPHFKQAFLEHCKDVTASFLDEAKSYNENRYHCQGIGRYDKQAVYQQGCDDLKQIYLQLGSKPYLFGKTPNEIDTTCFGYLANIYFYPIETPLKQFIDEHVELTQYVKRLAVHLGYITG
jgi:glutathione S-transferase